MPRYEVDTDGIPREPFLDYNAHIEAITAGYDEGLAYQTPVVPGGARADVDEQVLKLMKQSRETVDATMRVLGVITDGDTHILEQFAHTMLGQESDNVGEANWDGRTDGPVAGTGRGSGMAIMINDELSNFFKIFSGEDFPATDEDKLRRLKDVYDQLADGIIAAEPKLMGGVNRLRHNLDGPAAEAFVRSMDEYVRDRGYLRVTAKLVRRMGSAHRDLSTEVEYAKLMIIASLIQLVIELLIALAMSWINPGQALAQMAKAKIVMTFLAKTLWARILMEIAVSMVMGIAMQVLMDVFIQKYQLDMGTRSKWDHSKTRSSARWARSAARSAWDWAGSATCSSSWPRRPTSATTCSTSPSRSPSRTHRRLHRSRFRTCRRPSRHLMSRYPRPSRNRTRPGSEGCGRRSRPAARSRPRRCRST